MMTKTLLAVALLATLPCTSAQANSSEPEPLGWMAGKNGCHVLLTEQECQRHSQTLTALESFKQRYAYLESQGIPLRERETLCSCAVNTPPSVTYPQRRQHVARR